MNTQTKLKAHYQSCLAGQHHFAQKTVFSVEVYQGELLVGSDAVLQEVLHFRFPLDQQFDKVIASPVTEVTGALAHYRHLFNGAFAKAIRIIFY